jgi:hypothetical protein
VKAHSPAKLRTAGGLLAAGLCAAILTGCDFGLSGAVPTATPIVAPNPTASPAAVATATAPAPATAAATPAAAASPTAGQPSEPSAGQTWKPAGLTGQQLFSVGGAGTPGAPVYVGGTGVYRTTDAGASWSQLGFDTSAQAEDIVVSPSNPRVIYAGSGANCAGGPPGGQFRSTDGGATWAALSEAPHAIQVDAANENALTAIRCDGVVRSADGGQTWTALPDPGVRQVGNLTAQTLRVAPGDSSMIYAVYVSEGGTSRIRVSADGGKTWGGDETAYPGVADLLIDAKRPQRAWATAQTGLLRTIDGGQSWSLSSTGLDAAHNTAGGGVYQLSALAARYDSAGDLAEVYVGSYGTEGFPGAGVFGSLDAGQVWSRIGDALGGRAIAGLFVSRESGSAGAQVVLYAATDDGVHKLSLGAGQ